MTAPTYLSTEWDFGSFDPGAGLPVITRNPTYIGDQGTLNAVLLSAGKAGIELRFASTGPAPASLSTSPLSAVFAASQSNEGLVQRALRRYHYALAARNSEPLDVFFAAGDSLTDSAGVSTYAAKLAQRFAAHHRLVHPQTAAGGPGLMSAAVPTVNTGGAAGDAPQGGTVGGIYSPASGVPGWGLDSATAFLSGAGQTRQWTFVGTDIDVSWFATAAGAGAAALTVDGTNYGTYNAGTGALTAGAGNITTAASGVSTLARGRISGLTAGSHVVKWTWVSGVFNVNQAFGYNGDLASGARVAVQGYGGKGMRNYVGNAYGAPAAANPFPTGGQAEQWRQQIRSGVYLPDLVFMPTWANDAFGNATDVETPAQTLATAQQFVANLKADVVVGAAAAGVASYVPSFVSVPAHCISNAKPGQATGNGGTAVDYWQTYVSGHYALAANDPDGAVCVWDLGQRLQGPSNTWDQSRYNGLLWTDFVHLGNEGTDWHARSLVDFVRPR